MTLASHPPTPGTLVMSFDTELIWGSFDHTAPDAFERRFPDERGTIAGMLALLDRYEMPATWAVLGHLFLGACRRDPDGRSHPELANPQQGWYRGDWLAADPGTDRARDPLWYGDDILDAIEASVVRHEIGCHSFSHALFDDPAFSEEAVRADLAACRQLAVDRGIELRSFVFPRNREAHHGILREQGFSAFRGADPTWYASLPAPMRRVAHLVDQGAGLPPPVRQPEERLPGLWSIPGSMMLLHRSGIRRLVPTASRTAKARRGLERAAAGGGVFHLWTHPFNLAGDGGILLRAFESILRDAAVLRDAGRLRVATMAEVADGMAAGPPA